ncbi:MAG: GH3 auxin-responsive promoter family protein, partial [Oscillospiraceae bacterium]|nr:GH3 auxin-responsive promoter family protein [Oscillospiraceae bacterium]
IHTSLAALCEGVPFHNYIYGSSESFMAIATGMEELGEYTLMPTAGFFEFLPEHAGADAKPLLCSQLEVGGRYEIIVTNFSGLYRYRMQDILQVVRFEGTSPVLKMCYRINQIIDVAGEQFSSEELDAAVAQFIESTGLSCSGCCITDDYSVDPPRYAVYMEAGSDTSHGPLADILEDIFCRVQWGYACARRGNELSPLRLCLVPEGTFDRFEKLHGGDLNQYKPPKALLTSGQKAFFAQFDYPER